MPIDDMFNGTVNLLAKTLDLRARNHSQLAGNIANAETPNYVAKSISFEKELKGALNHSHMARSNSVAPHPRHIPIKGMSSRVEDVEGTAEEAPASISGRDGNRVDIEREMGKLAENQILYNASTQILSKEFEVLKYAVKGGN
ncbi:MAG: flagellar basal body rod protein FlgB [Geobacteraceae bacterium]|nr:flagellar basal body rod protein FlgB [Geobacteraceae bacterium]